MKFFIKDKSKNVRSTHNFFIASNSDTEVTGQLIRDTQFSFMGNVGDTFKLAICKKDNSGNIEEYDFDYQILDNNPIQIFEYPSKNKNITISFLHCSFDNKIMVYCPTFKLFS